MIFLPATPAQLKAIAKGQDLVGPRQAFSPNKALRETFDISPDSDEEADFAALQVASVFALATFGARFVLVVDVSAQPSQLESGNGGVEVQTIPADKVMAWFSDDEPAPRDLVESLRGKNIDEAWLAANDFMNEHDLSWHDISEA